jgi:hypothetical protein
VVANNVHRTDLRVIRPVAFTELTFMLTVMKKRSLGSDYYWRRDGQVYFNDQNVFILSNPKDNANKSDAKA